MCNTTTDHGPEHRIYALDITNGVLELSASVFGVLLNIVSLVYFLQCKRNIANTLYILIITNDILILVSIFPVAVSTLDHYNADLLGNLIMCNIFGFAFHVCSLVSVFLVAILSVSRSISVVFPFYRQKPVIHAVVIIVSFALYCFLQGLPYIFGCSGDQSYHYDSATGACRYSVGVLRFIKDSKGVAVTEIIIVVLPYIIPGIITAASCCVTVGSLLNSGHEHERRRKQNSRATTVVVMVTAVYLLMELPVWVLVVMQLCEVSMPAVTSIYTANFIYRVLVPLNASINPLVYIWYINGVRELFAQIFNAIKQKTILRI